MDHAGSDCNGTKIKSIERVDLKTLVPKTPSWDSKPLGVLHVKVAHYLTVDKNCASNS